MKTSSTQMKHILILRFRGNIKNSDFSGEIIWLDCFKGNNLVTTQNNLQQANATTGKNIFFLSFWLVYLRLISI